MSSEVQEMQGRKTGIYLLPTQKPVAAHEAAVHKVLGEKIATLLGIPFIGTYSHDNQISVAPYQIPTDTLIGKEKARAAGVKSQNDFFGGLVAQPFMATKAISHQLFNPNAQAPESWSVKFSKKTLGAVLKGFTVFTLSDAQQAGIRLLLNGPIRLKPVRACAGRGQIVVSNRNELAAAIANIDESQIGTWGLVLEEDLAEVITLSIGQVTIADIVISYVGTQHLTQDNEGETVYGGSTLDVVRGGYAQLSTLKLSENEQLAIEQARRYEEAAFDCFPDLIASRRNYDVAQGINAADDFCSGVLAQSWRIGGASGAEVFALAAFAQDNALHAVRSSTHELYGVAELPAHTAILYRGEDPEVGYLTKYVMVESYAYEN